MYRCLSCNTNHEHVRCPACGFEPPTSGGFATYAPDVAHDGDGYDSDLFAELAPLEAESFWFRSRNQLIQDSLLDACSGATLLPDSFFEVGCGTGFVLTGLGETYPAMRLVGSEIFVEGLAFARERLGSVELIQVDARSLPYTEEFGAIGAFDVLEHIEEDTQVLSEMYRALKPGGTLVVSVPQHRWLWSPADDYAHHVRRYTGKELRAKVTAAGFLITRDTSFVSFLLPLMVVSRLAGRLMRKPYDPRKEMQVTPIVNSVLRRVMTFERWLIRHGVRLPAGGSRLVVARRPV
jgi:SAM-dependent methyltransferase